MIRRVEMAVRGTVTRLRKRWRHIGRRHLRVMRKLDQSKIDWIIRQKEGGAPNRDIARAMDVSVRHVQRIHAAYISTGTAPVLRDSGRPRREAAPGEVEAVLRAHGEYCCGAVYLERILAETGAIHIPHNVIHRILRDNGLASGDPAKQGRRSWVRYERTYSNSMWHTDYKLLDDGRWFIAYQDDASRFITGYGVSARATGKHAIEVLHAAIKKHGRPASVLTDRGSQFYASESEHRRKGASEFEQELARLVRWWNEVKPHRSLDWENLETPARAFVRKMPPRGTVVKDEQTGESYHVR